MKLYLVKRKDDCGYDECCAVVVRAQNAREARVLASACNGDEGKATWLRPKFSTCRQISQEGKAEVILYDFHNA